MTVRVKFVVRSRLADAFRPMSVRAQVCPRVLEAKGSPSRARSRTCARLNLSARHPDALRAAGGRAMPPSPSPQGSWGKSPSASAARKIYSRIKYGGEDLSRFVVRVGFVGLRVACAWSAYADTSRGFSCLPTALWRRFCSRTKR